MKTKEEIKQWLLENCEDEYGNLDLSGLDFSDFDGDVFLFRMKVKENLYQYAQEVSGDLLQSSQKVEGNLIQDFQEVAGDLFQERQKVKGTIHQNALTNVEIDNQIKTLKQVISILEKQKVEEEGERK